MWLLATRNYLWCSDEGNVAVGYLRTIANIGGIDNIRAARSLTVSPVLLIYRRHGRIGVCQADWFYARVVPVRVMQ
jgi:hypothetical protein